MTFVRGLVVTQESAVVDFSGAGWMRGDNEMRKVL